VRRASLLGAHRFTGPVSRYTAGRWAPIAWDELAGHLHAALTAQTGVPNEEFLAQVAASHAGVTAALALPRPAAGADPRSRYLASERSLVFGHRFHPAPKARETGTGGGGWAAYAPEAGASFPVRLLGVREDMVVERQAEPGATAPLDALGRAPAGYRLLPVHPWQYALLRGHPALRGALRRGDVRDLGPTGERLAATASVRTLHARDGFLKFSLNVRITNCLRKNARYELEGAVATTRLLGPVTADLSARFPGHTILREPAFRSAALPGPGGAPDPGLLEGLGVIVRDGLAAATPPGAAPLLAAAVADEYPTGPAHISRLLPAGAGPAAVLRWWRAYLALLVPPALAAYTDHGVVLEPHLQNVLVCVTGDGLPAAVLFRDLEGTKLLREHHAAALDALPPGVAEPLTYDAEQGWTRLVYCLLVNNVGDMLAALADRCPTAEPALWSAVRDTLASCTASGGHPRVTALLAGAPLPAKANLLTRWHRSADRRAQYVHLPSPLRPAPREHA
jgi:siderophore synthetase component